MRCGGKFTPWSIDIKHHYVTLKLCFFFPWIEVFLSLHCRTHYSGTQYKSVIVSILHQPLIWLNLHMSLFPTMQRGHSTEVENKNIWHKKTQGSCFPFSPIQSESEQNLTEAGELINWDFPGTQCTMQIFRDDIKPFFKKDCITFFLIHMHLQYQSCHVTHQFIFLLTVLNRTDLFVKP